MNWKLQTTRARTESVIAGAHLSTPRISTERVIYLSCGGQPVRVSHSGSKNIGKMEQNYRAR